MDQKLVEQYFATKLEAEWGPYDLNKHKGADVIILDTRDAESFEEDHIPGAINIPEMELDARLGELAKNKTVVTYCWSITCHLATRVALKLAQKGYTVKELVGGIREWKNSELPTTGQKEPAHAH